MRKWRLGAVSLTILGLSAFTVTFNTKMATALESPWQEVPGAKIRLIAVAGQGTTPSANSDVDTAVEIALEPGWHTYWRFPGETGIPTQAIFDRSVGLRDISLRYPAPERYFDGQFTSIVYTDRVVLPIDLTLAPGPLSPRIVADVTFGVCSDICVPAEASLALDLSLADDAITQRMAISRARLALPEQQTDTPPRIAHIILGTPDTRGEQTLTIEAELAPGALKADLFAEGADGSFIEVPRRVAEDGISATFALSTHGLARTEAGRPLTLVLVNGPLSVRHDIDVDALAQR